MIEEGILKNQKVDAVIGLHLGSLYSKLKAGQVGYKYGPTMGCLDDFKIKVYGKGGHGALPNKTVDPVAISASLINNLQTLISREISPTHPGVISICKIRGGTTYNIIPEHVELEGTARFIYKDDRNYFSRRLEELSKKFVESRRGKLDFSYNFGYPPLVSNDKLIDFFKENAKEILAPEDIIELNEPIMVGEDMSYLLNEVPGIYFFLGSPKKVDGKYYSHHNSKFDIDENVLWIDTALFVKTVVSWLNNN